MILRRVGVLSLGKFMGFLYGLLGLLIGAVVSLVSLLGLAVTTRGSSWLVHRLGRRQHRRFPPALRFLRLLGRRHYRRDL